MIADLASSDLGKPLMTSLGLLADVERKAQDIESEQAKQDLVTLMGTADEYARLINSVRVCICLCSHLSSYLISSCSFVHVCGGRS